MKSLLARLKHSIRTAVLYGLLPILCSSTAGGQTPSQTPSLSISLVGSNLLLKGQLVNTQGSFVLLQSTRLDDLRTGGTVWHSGLSSSSRLFSLTVSNFLGTHSSFFRVMESASSYVPSNMVWVFPGRFTLGSPNSEAERFPDESPQTEVTITRGFWMHRYEVTQAEYLSVMGVNPSYFTGDLRRPVEQVSWSNAVAYCAALTDRELSVGRLPPGWRYRLPTEAERELAARCGTTTRFPHGDDPGYLLLPRYAWFEQLAGNQTHPVGELLPNPYGLHDMSGNVWEWCLDYYGLLPGGEVIDPTGPTNGTLRVLKGGSETNLGERQRNAARLGRTPDYTEGTMGFRIILEPAPPSPTAPDMTRFVWIGPGSFLMGSSPPESDRLPEEGPQTPIRLTTGYWIGRYEVTQGEYELLTGSNPSHFAGDPNRPVERVTWHDAVNYCRLLTRQECLKGKLPAGYSYRLPTEAEWEFAARGGSTTRFSFGNDEAYSRLSEYGWFVGNSSGATHPVGSKSPNAYGLFDVHGNVWEWCNDVYAPLGGVGLTDPEGPLAGPLRVNRGGSYLSEARRLRSAARGANNPADQGWSVGFRVVLAPDPSQDFLVAPPDGSVRSTEGSMQDPGGSEWDIHRLEEGDPLNGPRLTAGQQDCLRKVFAQRQLVSPLDSRYEGSPILADDGALVLQALTVLDRAYQNSFNTNGSTQFQSAVRRFSEKLSHLTGSNSIVSPFSLVLAYSRTLTPLRRVVFLTECTRNSEPLRDHLQTELWRLAVQERERTGWGYSGTPSSQGNPLLKSNVLAMLRTEARLNPVDDARGRLSSGPEFREISTALLWSETNALARLNLAEFITYLSVIAVPNGSISTHILGGTTGPLSVEGIVRPEYWFDDPSHIRELRNLMFLLKAIADLDARVTDLEERVADLEARVGSLESWALATDARLVNLERAVTNLEARVASLEAWRVVVDDRLAEIEMRLDLVETLGVPASATPLPRKEDRDEDRIDDRVERLLIDAFSPVFMINDDWRPPVSAEWFVQHSFLRGPGEDPDDFSTSTRAEWTRRRNVWRQAPYNFIPEYQRLVEEARQKYPESSESSWRLELDQDNFRDGDSDLGEAMSWERAKREGNVGMYAHVVRGNLDEAGRSSGEYIVQYFMLLTWNETTYSFGIGNHEGDWACATLFVNLPEYAPQGTNETLLPPDQMRRVQEVLESPARIERIITARVCNHGRYIDSRGENTDTVDVGTDLGLLRGGVKPRFWMEGGTHELWPNSGGRGYSGWPSRAAKNSRVPLGWEPLSPINSPAIESSKNKPYFKDGQVFDGSEFWVFGYATKFRPGWMLRNQGYRISFDFGEGETWDDLNEHKVARAHQGEKGAYVTRFIPNLGEITKELSKSAELVLRFRGLWGGWWKGNESPEGPWKDEMWVGPDPKDPSSRKAAQLDPIMRRTRVTQPR